MAFTHNPKWVNQCGSLPSEAERAKADWYGRRDELREGQVFTDRGGHKVKLDRRVPGDGTKWYVASWWGNSWAYMDATIEPGDLVKLIGHSAGWDGAVEP